MIQLLLNSFFNISVPSPVVVSSGGGNKRCYRTNRKTRSATGNVPVATRYVGTLDTCQTNTDIRVSGARRVFTI